MKTAKQDNINLMELALINVGHLISIKICNANHVQQIAWNAKIPPIAQDARTELLFLKIFAINHALMELMNLHQEFVVNVALNVINVLHLPIVLLVMKDFI